MLKNHAVRFVAVDEAGRSHRSGSVVSCRFRAKYSDTLKTLDSELSHLRARDVVIQLDCDESQLRRDGTPRSDARTNSPLVILSFESRFGPLSYPCCRFGAWQDNLRAIALSLQALRMVDRYGVTKRAEQYRGWRRITCRGDDEFPTPDAAAVFLSSLDAVTVSVLDLMKSVESVNHAYREASLKYHPDRGGDAAGFSRVSAAAEILRAYHRRRLSK